MRRPKAPGGQTIGGEQSFQKIIEYANEIVYTLSREGVFLFVSPAWTRSLGHPVEDVIGRSFELFVHPDDVTRYHGYLQRVLLESHFRDAVEYRVRHRDGTWRWHQSNGAVIPGDATQPATFVWIARDITAHRATRERLESTLAETRVRYRVSQALLGRDSEEEVLDTLIDVAGVHPGALVSLWSWDSESGHTIIVKRREGAFGSGIRSNVSTGIRLSVITYPSITQYLVNDVFWTNDLQRDERIDPATRHVLLGEEARSYATMQMRVGDDRLGLVIVVSKSTGYFNEENLLLYKTLADEGATALHTASLREAVRASEQRLSLVVRQSPLPIVEWDVDFDVVSWNPAAQRVFGYSAEETIGRSGFGLIVGESERPEISRRMAEFGESLNALDITRPTLTKDGRTIVCRWMSSPRINRDGSYVGAVSIIEDISMRIEAERELHESEQRYRTLAEVTHEGVVVHDRGAVVDCNAAFARMLGYTRTEILGMQVSDLVAPVSRELVHSQALAGAETAYETDSLRKDGSTFPTKVVSTPTLFRGGHVRIATLWDLTEERKAQRHLESALKLTQVRFQISQALAGAETEEHVIKALGDFVGLFPGSFVTLFTAEGPAEDPIITKQWQSIDSGMSSPIPVGARFTFSEQPLFRLLFQRVTFCVNDLATDTALPADTRDYFMTLGMLSCTALPLMTGNELLGFVLAGAREPGAFDQGTLGLMQTLAEQGAVALRAARLRAAARSSEADFRRVAENMRDLISEVDAGGVYRYASPSYRRVLGYETDVLVGDTFFTRVHPDDLGMMREIFSSSAKSGRDYEVECRYRHADGHYMWFSILSKSLFDEKGDFCGAVRVARDVTERRRADEEVHRLNAELEKRVQERTAQLEAANKELEAFSYSVSHDLRAPLRAINGFSRIINDEWGGRLPPEVSHHLRTIRENTSHMAMLIEGLLSLARLSRHELHMKQIITRQMVAEVIAGMEELTQGREVEFVVGELPDCSGDPVLLRQVWVNLIDNALKFTRCRPHARIEIGGAPQDETCTFSVKDNGVGFDMRYADRLFGVFQRLHSGDEYEGNGIGLANVQRIIHRHGGRIWAESAPEQGATFFFAL
jgi:PAS domain S-box-containing protein